MDKHIMKILEKVVRVKGMEIVTDEDCYFKAEKGWGTNKEIIDIYFNRYSDETYDITLDKVIDESVELVYRQTTRIEKEGISEQELISLLDEFIK